MVGRLGQITYGSYFGGSGVDHGRFIAIDPTFGAVYVLGETNSTDLQLQSARQTTPAGAFVAKFKITQSGADAGVTPADVGVTPADGGVPPTEGGAPPPDRGAPPADSGAIVSDVGGPAADGNVPTRDGGGVVADRGMPRGNSVSVNGDATSQPALDGGCDCRTTGSMPSSGLLPLLLLALFVHRWNRPGRESRSSLV